MFSQQFKVNQVMNEIVESSQISGLTTEWGCQFLKAIPLVSNRQTQGSNFEWKKSLEVIT